MCQSQNVGSDEQAGEVSHMELTRTVQESNKNGSDGSLHQRHRQTDGQTDGRTTYDSNTALALRASRGKIMFPR